MYLNSLWKRPGCFDRNSRGLIKVGRLLDTLHVFTAHHTSAQSWRGADHLSFQEGCIWKPRSGLSSLRLWVNTQAPSTQWHPPTCQLGVGLHVIYGCGESEHPPSWAFNLDVPVRFQKGLCEPGWSYPTFLSLFRTFCCETELWCNDSELQQSDYLLTWSLWCCPLCAGRLFCGDSSLCGTCHTDCPPPVERMTCILVTTDGLNGLPF